MNNSTELPESFRAIHSVIHVLIFVVLPVPLVIVTGMSIVALLTAKDVNWKMKVVLINILVPDIIVFISLIFYDFGYPVRVYLIEGNDTDAIDVSCLISIILYGIAFLGSAFGGALFSVSVYIFTKHGVKKLKWIGILSYIATTWVLILMYRIIPIVFNLNTLGVISIGGFCIFPITPAFIVNITIDVLLVLLNITFVVIFSTCNFIFVKKNQIATENSNGPDPLKKAMTKVMIVDGVNEFCALFLLATNFTSFMDFGNVSPIIQYVIYYILLIIPTFIILLAPIAIAIFINPVNDRLKQIFKLQSPLHSYCKVCKRDDIEEETANPQ